MNHSCAQEVARLHLLLAEDSEAPKGSRPLWAQKRNAGQEKGRGSLSGGGCTQYKTILNKLAWSALLAKNIWVEVLCPCITLSYENGTQSDTEQGTANLSKC